MELHVLEFTGKELLLPLKHSGPFQTCLLCTCVHEVFVLCWKSVCYITCWWLVLYL